MNIFVDYFVIFWLTENLFLKFFFSLRVFDFEIWLNYMDFSHLSGCKLLSESEQRYKRQIHLVSMHKE